MGNRKPEPVTHTPAPIPSLLSEMVDKLGLQEVARRIGYNKTTVCHVLRGTYKGSPAAIIKATQAAYGRERVSCPVLGEIPLARCVTERTRPFTAINPLRVKLARTCPTCKERQARGER